MLVKGAPGSSSCIITLRSRQNGHHFADDILKCIFLDENIWICIEISLKFVHKGLINNKAALVRVMACRHFLNQWWLSSMTHLCVTRPQRVNASWRRYRKPTDFIMTTGHERTVERYGWGVKYFPITKKMAGRRPPDLSRTVFVLWFQLDIYIAQSDSCHIVEACWWSLMVCWPYFAPIHLQLPRCLKIKHKITDS